MGLSVALDHRFPGFRLDVAFEAPGGVTALFGRSGSGKTTVVNAVAGLLAPEAGRVVAGGAVLLDTAEGRFVPPHRRRVGVVFQEGRLFPHLSVRANLSYGRWFARWRMGERRDGRRGGRRDGHGGDGDDGAEMARLVDLLGLGPLLDRRPGRLSGGEKQRVAIGRALLARPRLLLLDEPLAALDGARKAEILPYLERLRDETRVPMLYVSHAVAEVARLATTVVVLEAGRVVRAGPAAAVLADPGAAPTLGVREAGAVLAATLVGHHDDGLSELAFAGGRLLLPRVAGAPGARLRLRILAQDVVVARGERETLAASLSALNLLSARVTGLREGEGPGVIVALDVGAETLLARVTRRSAARLALAPGVACLAVVKAVSVARLDIGTDLGTDPAPLGSAGQP